MYRPTLLRSCRAKSLVANSVALLHDVVPGRLWRVRCNCSQRVRYCNWRKCTAYSKESNERIYELLVGEYPTHDVIITVIL